MIQQKQLAGGLLALGISIALQASVSAATDTPSTSWLMSEAEVNAHTAAMARLEGQARDDYRNAQYEQLKKRAQEHGFKLPADPPWANTANNPAVDETGEDTAAAAAARHAEMREKLQARRETMQQASEANLEHLKEAANAQQQKVDAQLQAQDTPKPEPTADAPPAPSPVTETAVAPPMAPAALAPTPAPTPAAPAPVAVTQNPTPPASMPITPPQAPTPPAAPAPPTRPTAAAVPLPRFAPVEQSAQLAPVPAQTPTGETGDLAPDAVVAAGQPSDSMSAYRDDMRARFDEYMQERQMLMEENARRQREQHEAAMEKNRALRANRSPYPPYPYPAAPPSYGPRYPAAYPGYRTPYWQQQ